MDALQLLREDHQHVKELFRKFEDAENSKEKKRIADEAIMELDIHAQIEEEVFYPAIRKLNSDIDDIMNEADEEHHVAKLLMTELTGMAASDDHFEAKFMVLAENVRHHIQEEESEMLPKAAEAGRAKLDKLGEQMEMRKMELQRSYSGHKRETYEATSGRGASRNRRTASRGGGTRTTSRRTTTAARGTGTRTRAAATRRTTGRATTGARRSATTRTSGTRTRTTGTRTRATATKRTTASRPRTAASRSRARTTSTRRTATTRPRAAATRRTTRR